MVELVDLQNSFHHHHCTRVEVPLHQVLYSHQ
jgi:hypothetical protein